MEKFEQQLEKGKNHLMRQELASTSNNDNNLKLQNEIINKNNNPIKNDNQAENYSEASENFAIPKEPQPFLEIKVKEEPNSSSYHSATSFPNSSQNDSDSLENDLTLAAHQKPNTVEQQNYQSSITNYPTEISKTACTPPKRKRSSAGAKNKKIANSSDRTGMNNSDEQQIFGSNPNYAVENVPSSQSRSSRRTSKPKVFEDCITYGAQGRGLKISEKWQNQTRPQIKNELMAERLKERMQNTSNKGIENSNFVNEMNPETMQALNLSNNMNQTAPNNAQAIMNINNESTDQPPPSIYDTMFGLSNLNTIQAHKQLDHVAKNNNSGFVEPTNMYTAVPSFPPENENINHENNYNNQHESILGIQITPRKRGRPRKSQKKRQRVTITNDDERSTSGQSSANQSVANESDTNATGNDSNDDGTDKLSKPGNKPKKKRGRRPKQKVIEADSDYGPRLSLKPTEYHKEYTTIEIQFLESEVICGRCSDRFPKSQWPRHNLNKHNNMAWLEGHEPPNYERDERVWRSMLTVAHKQRRGTLTCDKCNVIKRSVIGFVSHYKFCGISAEEKIRLMWTCPICRGVFMPSSQDVHERMHRDTARKEEELRKQNLNAEDFDGKKKRKAAEKAATKITEFTELVRENDAPVLRKSKAQVNIEKFIEQPQLSKSIPNVWKGHWMRAIAANQKAVCRQPGCTFSASTIEEICNHHGQCNFTPQKAFVCRICRFLSESCTEITEHIKSEHSQKLFVDMEDQNSDFHASDQSDNGEDTLPIVEQKSRKPLVRRTQYIKFDGRAVFLKKVIPSTEGRTLPTTYIPTIRWTLDFELENYQFLLFPNLLPNYFLLLNNSDAEKYLPKLTTSMKTKQMKTLREVNECDDDLDEWKTWSRFESAVNNEVPTFFVGGPIWAIAWLPIPTALYANQCHQYVAISTHPTMDNIHVVGESYKCNNIIQIWDVGHLSKELSFIPLAPKLVYAIAHEHGTIWNIQWCPSGVYSDLSLNNDKFGRRMGLLAIASSDGCVHIYSLPFPDFLNFEKSKNHDLPIYKTDPVLTLHINKLMNQHDKLSWQCLTLSWNKLLGHDIIAAGFSNGYIALWNLTASSRLLISKIGATIHINAYQHFYAHGQAVTYVELIPIKGKKFLASSSLDRCSKVWDLDDVMTPNAIEVTKRGIGVNGAWLMHWPNILTSYDDALGLGHTSTYMIGLREICNKVYPLLPTNSVAYGIAVSDYANGICHGTVAGEIAAIFPQQLLYFKDLDKLTKKRWLLSSVEVTDFEPPEENDKPIENDKSPGKSKSKMTEHDYMPESYSKCAERFGITFHDDLNNAKSRLVKKSVRRNPLNSDNMRCFPIEQYQFASVNRIAWNPNAWSYLWIAVGYQNGLIRLLHLKALSPDKTAMTILPDYKKTIMGSIEKNTPPN